MMAAVEAAGGGTEHAVMTGIMAGDAADDGALDAALGVGGGGRAQHEQCGSNGDERGFHGSMSPCGVDISTNKERAGFPRCEPRSIDARRSADVPGFLRIDGPVSCAIAFAIHGQSRRSSMTVESLNKQRVL